MALLKWRRKSLCIFLAGRTCAKKIYSFYIFNATRCKNWKTRCFFTLFYFEHVGTVHKNYIENSKLECISCVVAPIVYTAKKYHQGIMCSNGKVVGNIICFSLSMAGRTVCRWESFFCLLFLYIVNAIYISLCIFFINNQKRRFFFMYNTLRMQPDLHWHCFSYGRLIQIWIFHARIPFYIYSLIYIYLVVCFIMSTKQYVSAVHTHTYIFYACFNLVSWMGFSNFLIQLLLLFAFNKKKSFFFLNAREAYIVWLNKPKFIFAYIISRLGTKCRGHSGELKNLRINANREVN